MDLKMNIPQMQEFLQRDFSQMAEGFGFVSLSVGEITMSLKVRERHLRPGGTVSGPAMFALADVSAYFATLGLIGPVALAVTTNCSIDFMRKPAPGLLFCRMQVLKLGRALAVCEGHLFTEGAAEKPVARASLTYSIPPMQG